MAYNHCAPNGPFKDQHPPVLTPTPGTITPLMDVEVAPPAPGKRPVEPTDLADAWSEVKQRSKKVKTKTPPPTPVSNQFKVLARIPSSEGTTTSAPIPSPTKPKPAPTKPELPPPIIFDVGYPISKIRNAVKNSLKIENFEMQQTRRGLKLFLKTQQDYDQAYMALVATRVKGNPVHFHTFAPKGSGPNKKFLLIGFDEDHDLESIKSAISHDDLIDVRRLTAVREGVRVETTNVLVTFKPHYDPAEHLSKLKAIDNVIFKVKPFATNRALPTCMRCQQIGHTKRYCWRAPRCANCGGEHEVGTTCSPDTPPRCCNCGGEHRASYKQCPARLRLLQRKSASKVPPRNAPSATTYKPAPPPKTNAWDNHAQNSRGAQSASHHLFPETRPSTSQVPPFYPPETFSTAPPSWLTTITQTLMSMLKELTETVKTLVATLPNNIAK